MKKTAITVLFAFATMFGAASYTAAAPAHESIGIVQTSKNGNIPENNDPVTNEGSNQSSHSIQNAEQTAGGLHINIGG